MPSPFYLTSRERLTMYGSRARIILFAGERLSSEELIPLRCRLPARMYGRSSRQTWNR